MTRYKNITTGVVVSVRDDKVLDSQWESFDGSHSESNDSPYKGVTVPDLKAEIAKRNEGREDDAKVSDEGKRADLVAALVADDTAHPGE